MPLPEIRVVVGLTPEELDRISPTPIPWSLTRVSPERGRIGTTFLTFPHVLSYESTDLSFKLPKAGADISMATGISVGEDKVYAVSAPVLPEYLPLKVVSARARKLLDEIRAQGFEYIDDPYAKFATLARDIEAQPPVPTRVNSFEEMEALFLNRDYFVGEMIVFILQKNHTRVDVRLVNMRRKFPPVSGLESQLRSDLKRKEKAQLSDADLEEEPVYRLNISISMEKEQKIKN